MAPEALTPREASARRSRGGLQIGVGDGELGLRFFGGPAAAGSVAHEQLGPLRPLGRDLLPCRRFADHALGLDPRVALGRRERNEPEDGRASARRCVPTGGTPSEASSVPANGAVTVRSAPAGAHDFAADRPRPLQRLLLDRHRLDAKPLFRLGCQRDRGERGFLDRRVDLDCRRRRRADACWLVPPPHEATAMAQPSIVHQSSLSVHAAAPVRIGWPRPVSPHARPMARSMRARARC